MKTTQMIAAAAIALLGSSAAFASGEAELQRFGLDQAASTVTRAQVQADVIRAQARGDLNIPGEVWAGRVPSTRDSAVARSDVRSELRAAVANGDLNVPSEVTASAVPKASTVDRAVVRAEARAQAKAGPNANRGYIGAGY